MNRKWTNLTRIIVMLAVVSVAVAAIGKPQYPAKYEKPKKGMGRYVFVLWEAGTPVPGGDGKKHMGKITEPDFVKLGGTILSSEANRRVVDLPVKEAEKLKKHGAVSSMQRMWMGEPYSELEEDSVSNGRFELTTEADTNLDWGPKAYQYDGSGNIRAIGPDSFAYDTAGRLIQSTVGGKTETFKYDEFGNLTEKAIAGANPVTIPVDGASNRMIGVGYDAKGNVTERSPVRTYSYDALNMLSTDSGNGGRDMVYDADDERIGVIIDSQLSRWWIRDFEGKVIREYQGQFNQQIWIWEQDWIYGEGQLVGGERVPFWWQNEENGRTYTFGGKRHYHLDHIGSVRMVTDASGRSVSEHDYYAFGVTPTKAYQEQINWGDPHIDAMRFAGHQREFLGFINTENTEYLDYMHARYYDPNLGRFLSVDPSRSSVSYQLPQTWNRYSYVVNNPLTFVDPDGRATILIRDKNGFRFADDDNDDGIPDDMQGDDPDTSGQGIFGSSNIVDVQRIDRIMTATLGLINNVGISLLSWTMPGVGPAAKTEAKAGITITARGLAIVEKHLALFGDDAANAAMVARLRSALDTGRRVTSADANFYLHELAEATMMRNGMSYETAHAAALGKYGVSNYALYHPEVIGSNPGLFNNAWRAFWGLP